LAQVLTLPQRVIKQLQADLPLCSHPFREIAHRVGATEEQVLSLVSQYLEQGVIRRFGAILGHQRLGFVANGMGVWRVPEEDAARVGEIMAGFPEVSHCYQRPSSPAWPYNLYTMIHGASYEECEQVAARISRKTGIRDYRLLFSTRELKKTSMVYY
jgi:DNA-binding Lrp family transcriptional regulator